MAYSINHQFKQPLLVLVMAVCTLESFKKCELYIKYWT